MPTPTCRGIMGIGVDWMGLTLATGLSSGREMCRLKIKKLSCSNTDKLVWNLIYEKCDFCLDCRDNKCDETNQENTSGWFLNKQ